MFNIIGCFLALVPLCASSPQPLKANNVGGYFGAYNLREIDYETATNTPELYEFDNFIDGMFDSPIIYYSTENTYQQYNYFSISYEPTNLRWLFEFGQTGYVNYQFYLYAYDTTFNDQTNDAKYFTFYFKTYNYFPTSVANVLDFFFTKQPNSYHEIYTGYYTFKSTITGSYNLYGNVSANNVLFNHYVYYDNHINFYYLPNTTEYYALYEPSKFNASRSIYFSGMFLPNQLKNYMETRGVFAFVPSTNMSDFEDLFFALADTPIYYITTWFNFELLGFNFGVALVSMLSVLLIVFLLRKLV